MTYTFYDRVQEMTITIMAKTEDEAWLDLADAFGSVYVLDNIAYMGKNIF